MGKREWVSCIVNEEMALIVLINYYENEKRMEEWGRIINQKKKIVQWC